MFLVVDAGNSSTVFGFFDEAGNLTAAKRFTTSEIINDFSWMAELSAYKVKFALIGSVTPKANKHLERACLTLFKVKPMFVGDANTKLPIIIKEDHKKVTGADRIANAIAGFRVFNHACVVIDMGTATTFDYVDNEGNLCGSSFVPGVEISLEALCSRAALLPKIEIKKVDKVIATNSIDAMRSGIFYGYLSLIEGMVARIRHEKGEIKVIITGGLAQFYAEHTKSINHFDENLTLKGLLEILKFNLVIKDNPDLPPEFIKGVLEAKKEMEQGKVSKFKFRK